MKATELMIGDWVQPCSRSYPVQVESLSVDTINGDMGAAFDPVPLTPEILEKNGWKTIDRYRYNRGGVWFDIINRGVEDFDIEVSAYDGGFAYVATIYNVHELQHALRLCGIKKEILL